MNMYEILLISVSLLTGFLFGYLTSYIKEKGKNRATIEDTKLLTEEKEKVTSKFDLENSKRKYKYEYKSNLYIKYFNLLDDLNTKSNEEAQTEFLPALSKFNASFLIAQNDSEKEMEATIEFSESIQGIMAKSNQSQLRFKTETASLKIIAGEEVLRLLEETEIANDEALNRSAVMMKDYASLLVSRQMDKLEQYKSEIEETANKLNALKLQLRQAVRKELDEI